MRELQVTETSMISGGKCIPAAFGIASIAALAGITVYIFKKKTKNKDTHQHHKPPRPVVVRSSAELFVNSSEESF